MKATLDPDARSDRAREARLRRRAHNLGLAVVKSRCRTPQACEHGTYMIVDLHTNGLAAWSLPNGYGMNLDDVAHYLGEASRAK